MASLYTSYYHSGSGVPLSSGDFRFRLDFSSSQDNANNRSTINTSLYLETVNQPAGASGRSWLGGTYINGIYYEFGNFHYAPPAGSATRWCQSKSVIINHNADGTRQIYLQARGGRYWSGSPGYFDYTYTSNYFWSLPTIPKYANFNDTHVQWVTINKASFYVKADAPCDFCRYYLNGSSSWTDMSSGTSYDYAFTVGGFAPKTSGYVQVEVKRADSQLWTKSNPIYFTTNDYGRITSSTINANSDTSLRATSSAPQTGASYDIYIELLNSTKTARIGSIIQHSNTLDTTFTAAELLSLANYIPTVNSCNFRINVKTIHDGYEWLDYKDGTYSVINANPTFSNFTYEDYNSSTIALTGNNQKIIKGYSNLRAKVSLANKAVARKGATMSKYRLVVGTKQVDVNYSSSADVLLSLTSIANNVFTVYAIDSRGNSTLKQISPSTYINYFDRYFSTPIPLATRTGGIGTETTLSLTGLFLNSSFGSVTNNVSLTYKYKKTSATTYVNGTTTLTPVKTGNNFTFSGLIAGDLGATGFDAQFSYDIKITATDSLGSTSYDVVLGTGKPNIAISENGVAFNAPYDEAVGGDLQVGGKDISNVIDGIVLYSNSSGSNGNITTSDSAINYNKYEIIFKDNDGYVSSVIIHNPNGKTTNLSTITNFEASVFMKGKLITISGTSISNFNTAYSQVRFSGTSLTITNVNIIYITKVIGYR